MIPSLKKKTTINKNDNLIILCNIKSNLSSLKLSENEMQFVDLQIKRKQEIIKINQYHRFIVLIFPKKHTSKNHYNEQLRILGDKVIPIFRDKKSVVIKNLQKNSDELILAEGIFLGMYSFSKYKTNSDVKEFSTIIIYNGKTHKLIEMENILSSVYLTRDLVNEPFSHLTAKELSEKAKEIGESTGCKVNVFGKKKIQSLKMGGLLAVNKGSLDDPSFTIMEWKPKNHKNKNPIVLVGKGIVFDTGGLSLKPTNNSMDLMKIDMGGAATIMGAMQAICHNNLPVHTIALLPATDNRPSGNAYAPGDVVEMHNGSTVEVLNTDAEGRMILADALSYAKKYNPQLVIDLATLTGSAVATIGKYGMVSMHNDAKTSHDSLKNIGEEIYERLAELPFWPEYDKLIESDIADIKNIGGPQAGAITAGKFLSYFTNYPWIHIDLSCVYSKERFEYRGKGATGMGVRLLYYFIKSLS